MKLRTATARGLYIGMLALMGVMFGANPCSALDNIFFQHHSVGRNLIANGEIRQALNDYNLANGTQFELWDHDYNYIGMMNPAGVLVSGYNLPSDTRTPPGQHQLWTTANAARDSILANHEMIIFKLGYDTCYIDSDTLLDQYKQYYLGIRDAIDSLAVAYPDKVFVAMSPSPLHWRSITDAEAARARAFANWMKSAEYLEGHDNLFCFDLFDQYANPADAPENANKLRLDYTNPDLWSDSHPTPYADQQVAPVFVDFLISTALMPELAAAPAPDAGLLRLESYPNPFNPRTTIAFDLPQRSAVTLAIYDVSGRRVKAVYAGEILPEGRHEAIWDGTDSNGARVASGAYFMRLETARGVKTHKLLLTK